jgi:hypothetical protein
MLHFIDRDRRLVEASDRWPVVLGHERQEVIGRKASDFLSD